MWPVGICGGLKYEGPICKNGTVIDWYAAWGKKRAFQIDMAGENKSVIATYTLIYVHILSLQLIKASQDTRRKVSLVTPFGLLYYFTYLQDLDKGDGNFCGTKHASSY